MLSDAVTRTSSSAPTAERGGRLGSGQYTAGRGAREAHARAPMGDERA